MHGALGAVFAASLAAFATPVPVRAQEGTRAFDGAELGRIGAIYEKTVREGRYESGQELAESQYFRGFVIGVALTGAKLGFLCPGDGGVNFRGLWNATAAYLREHSEQWAQEPEALVLVSLREAFPCDQASSPTPGKQ
jgi:hypothetical protein